MTHRTASWLQKKTEASASPVLGTMNFGGRTNEAESLRIIDCAYEYGIRMVDTANSYNQGRSEEIVGKAIRRQKEKCFVATKVGARMSGREREGLAPEVMTTQCAESRRRLGVDVIDLYYLHVPDKSVEQALIQQSMESLTHSGQVQEWGMSNFSSWEMLSYLHQATEPARPKVAQQLFNAVHRELEIEYFAFARRFQMHTMVYNVLAAGLLTGRYHEPVAIPGSRFAKMSMYRSRYLNQVMIDRSLVLAKLASDAGTTLMELAYSWAFFHPEIDSVLVGPASVAQLEVAMAASKKNLAAGVREAVDALSVEWAGTDTHYCR